MLFLTPSLVGWFSLFPPLRGGGGRWVGVHERARVGTRITKRHAVSHPLSGRLVFPLSASARREVTENARRYHLALSSVSYLLAPPPCLFVTCCLGLLACVLSGGKAVWFRPSPQACHLK